MFRRGYTLSMGKKDRKQDLIPGNWRKTREFSIKKESFDFDWVEETALDRKRKGNSVAGVGSSQKKSKFDFDEGFVLLSESASVSKDDCLNGCCYRKEVISPSSVKPRPPKRGRGRPRKDKRDGMERMVKNDEDVVIIDCDEVDVAVNNIGENETDSSVHGECGVKAESRTGGSENSVVTKKCVSVGIQAEDDHNLVMKKCVSVGVQVSEDDWKFLDFTANDSGGSGVGAASEGRFCQNEFSDHGLTSPCLENDGSTSQSDGLNSDAGRNGIGSNVDGVAGASGGHFCQNESSDHGLRSPSLENDARTGQCDGLKSDAGENANGSNVDVKLSNSNPLKDPEGGVFSEDDAVVLSGDIEYVGETSGSYVSMDEISPCESEDEDSKFCEATSVKDEDCSEQNTANSIRNDCVARRTRSHFTKAVDMKLGTFSHPLCLGDDDDDDDDDDDVDDVSLVDSSSDDDAHESGHRRNKKSPRKTSKTNQKRHSQDSADNFNVEDHNDGKEDICNGGGGASDNGIEDEEDVPFTGKASVGAKPLADENPLSNGIEDEEDVLFTGKASVGAKVLADKNQTTKKRVRSLKSYDAAKILIASMLEHKEIPIGEEMEASAKLICLPTKFWYHTQEPKPLEKSEYEKEMDKLWNEMEYCHAYTEIGSAEPNLVDKETNDVGRDILCPCGRDGLILDEEVGVKCKYCSYLHHEIREIAPEFDSNPFGKGDYRASLKGGDYFFKGFCSYDSVSSSQDGGPYPQTGGTVWDLIPGIRSTMYPHQQEGFEFIWRNIAGSTELDELARQTRPDGGSGCIISHAPGTGKSRLTIVFIQTFMKLFPMCRPVIIAPRSMLLTWEEEFQKWKVDIPFHNLNKPEFSGQEREKAMLLGDNSPHWIRLVKLYSWYRKESILAISYQLFEKLAGQGKKKKNRHEVDEKVRNILLESPGLLILDEGHTPRNDQSLIWKTLCQVQTQRRIILSGTPFQNNFEELLNTIYLVRPKIFEALPSGPHGMKRGRKVNLLRENWATLTNSIWKNNHALEKLRKMIDPFVHVHKGTILQESLPGLRDSVVILQVGDLQKTLLEDIKGIKNPLDLSRFVSLISVHPALLPEQYEEENGVSISIDRRKLERLKNEPEVGVKTKFLIELTRLSEALKEKVLVFSQFIDPLALLMEQLSSTFHWTEGQEILYMDGQQDIKQKQNSINTFNSPTSEARVLLASLKACSEGINLVGASRVVLLDVVWNPSVERQAISRAYRLGQEKMVHVYHLIASGTYEEEKYCRQLEKDRLSELVFSSSDRIRKGKDKVSVSSSDDQILREMVEHPKLNHIFEKIIEQPKEKNLIDCYDLIDLTDPQPLG